MSLILLAAMAVGAMEPQPLLQIGTDHRLIEGVATDGRTIFVSSMIDGSILACRATCRTFAKLPEPLHPIGMAWDRSRDRLWIAADCPPLPGFTKCDKGALIGLDRSGSLRERLLPQAETFHIGDVTAESGNVFVGDATNGAVYWLKPGAKSLSTLQAPGIGRSAQGMALDGTGKTLIVADYGQGITAIDLSDGARTLMLRKDGTPLRGVDGLVRCGGRYLAVFNGAQPNRLLSITLAGGRIAVDEIYSGPALPAPTQLAVQNRRLLIAADGDWDKALKAGAEPHGTHPIRYLPIGDECRPAKR